MCTLPSTAGQQRPRPLPLAGASGTGGGGGLARPPPPPPVLLCGLLPYVQEGEETLYDDRCSSVDGADDSDEFSEDEDHYDAGLMEDGEGWPLELLHRPRHRRRKENHSTSREGKAASVLTVMHRRAPLPQMPKENHCKLGEKRGMLMKREMTVPKGREHDVLRPQWGWALG
jgi:hypothetical protein